MVSTREYITFLVVLLLLTPLGGATENQAASGGNKSISIGNEYTGLTDFIKQIFSNPFSTVGAQTNIWVADNFNIGQFSTVRIDISGEKYTYNHGDDFKILSFFNNPRGQNIRMKIFKVDKANNNNLVLNYDTGNYKTSSSWDWAYWITTRNNQQAGTYIVKSYYNDNVVRTREYTVNPLPPSTIFKVDNIYQTGESINTNLFASKGSVNIHKYNINFGDSTTIEKTINAGSINTPITHTYDNAGDYTITLTITDTELNEYKSTYPVQIVDAGLYSDTILDYEEYKNINKDGTVNVKITITPNLDRHYRVLIDGKLVYDSENKISTQRGFETPIELFIGKHDITAESSYAGISYVEVYNDILYARYVPTIAYNTNYVDSISGTLEHNEALIDTEILLYKNGEYETKTTTVNGYFTFTNLEDGIYNIIFKGNNEYVDISSPQINIGDTTGIDVKTIDLNNTTITGFFTSIINWLRGIYA